MSLFILLKKCSSPIYYEDNDSHTPQRFSICKSSCYIPINLIKSKHTSQTIGDIKHHFINLYMSSREFLVLQWLTEFANCFNISILYLFHLNRSHNINVTLK